VAITPEMLRAGGPGVPARPLLVSAVRTARRRLADRIASRIVVAGGIIVIAAILAILVVIGAEVLPLFRASSATLEPTRAIAGAGPETVPVPGVFGADEYRESAFTVTADGRVRLVGLTGDGAAPAPAEIPALAGARVVSGTAVGRGRYMFGTSDGRLIPLEISFDVGFEDGRRTLTPKIVSGDASVLDAERQRPVLRLAGARPERGAVTAAQLGPRELLLQAVVERKGLIGPSRREESVLTLTAAVEGEVTAMVIDARGEDLFLGTSVGELVRYDLRDAGNPTRAGAVQAGRRPGTSITALEFLLGDRTLVVGDSAGGVSTWQVVPPRTGGERRLTRIHAFDPHAGGVVAIASSPRDKGFATAGASGDVRLHYATSGQTLLDLAGPAAPVVSLAFGPKADGLLAIDGGGRIAHWRLRNPHPEATLGTLFGKVWYEGYAEPTYVWQSTGGSDDFEAKLSLTPLIHGTLKGTLYALLVAVPIALLAALYVSEFMHPSMKATIKPVVEIMAALPSVVLGFLAGLWLAPMIERIVPGLLVLPPVFATAILGALVLWRLAPAALRGRVRPGSEAVLLVPVAIVAGWAAFAIGGVLEGWLLGGDYRRWLLEALGLTYDQRNSLVVGIAMGFAVIPIVFTIAEDSLANVPQHLRAGSLALGATRWQTAIRVVLPTASPGIFSAVMIGFGRAVGETMIVLMATGNTPVMDWFVFSGFRALSANIAVELPEAPEGGTLFRVLFLAAFLLFCFTAVVNTAAELVRLRLRRKYRYL
jgi:phosphate transport system permease protein